MFNNTENEKILSCFGIVMSSSYHFPVNGKNILKIRKNPQRSKVFLREFS